MVSALLILVEFSKIDSNHDASLGDTMVQASQDSIENNIAENEIEESKICAKKSEKAFYENLTIPVSELPVKIQKMMEKGDGFQKEFQVSHCYVCL